MGIVWQTYHKRVLLLGVPENPTDSTWIFSNEFWLWRLTSWGFASQWMNGLVFKCTYILVYKDPLLTYLFSICAINFFKWILVVTTNILGFCIPDEWSRPLFLRPRNGVLMHGSFKVSRCHRPDLNKHLKNETRFVKNLRRVHLVIFVNGFPRVCASLLGGWARG